MHELLHLARWLRPPTQWAPVQQVRHRPPHHLPQQALRFRSSWRSPLLAAVFDTARFVWDAIRFFFPASETILFLMIGPHTQFALRLKSPKIANFASRARAQGAVVAMPASTAPPVLRLTFVLLLRTQVLLLLSLLLVGYAATHPPGAQTNASRFARQHPDAPTQVHPLLWSPLVTPSTLSRRFA